MKLSEVCRLQIQTGEPDSFVLDQSELNDNDINLAGLEDFRFNNSNINLFENKY